MRQAAQRNKGMGRVSQSKPRCGAHQGLLAGLRHGPAPQCSLLKCRHPLPAAVQPAPSRRVFTQPSPREGGARAGPRPWLCLARDRVREHQLVTSDCAFVSTEAPLSWCPCTPSDALVLFRGSSRSSTHSGRSTGDTFLQTAFSANIPWLIAG